MCHFDLTLDSSQKSQRIGRDVLTSCRGPFSITGASKSEDEHPRNGNYTKLQLESVMLLTKVRQQIGQNFGHVTGI